MHPLLIGIGSYHLSSYAAFVAVGGVIALTFLRARAGEAGLRTEGDFWVLVNTILASGFIGARLFAMLVTVPPDWAAFWHTLVSVNSDFSVFGFIAGTLIGTYWFSRARQIQSAQLLDSVCLVIPIWQVFGRFGCFMNGCCFGRPVHGDVPWAVAFTDPRAAVPKELLGVALHPVQLYEVGGLVLLVGVLLVVVHGAEKARSNSGLVCVGYCAGYGVIRFVTEWFRGDAAFVRRIPVTVGQASSLALILLAVMVARLRRQGLPGRSSPLISEA
ncbi:MAG: prolipoprotein diacylglyceryl transferase [Thermoanaerobaculia bacterium]